MDPLIILKMLFGTLVGLGVFLFGMKNMSEGMQAVFGERLRKLIHSVTSNRLWAVVVGVVVTCFVQSSTITTVMVIGFVNSGFMTLVQAIGVIMGANIGTTITGWILVINIGKYGLVLFGVAAFFFLFGRNEKWRYLGMAVMGIGLIFFGLELMKDSFKPLRTYPEFAEWFAMFSADTYFGVIKAAFVGCVLTLLVQSSSATLGITMGLASIGIIDFQTSAALVLGENIGTTITAYLASIGGSSSAKRAAYSHVIFNVIGVAWITAVFPFYLELIQNLLGGDISKQVVVGGEITYPNVLAGIALVHTVFNVTNTIIFIPLLPLLAGIVTRLVPEKELPKKPHLRFLDVATIGSPVFGIGLSHDHVLAMAQSVREMSDDLQVLMTETPLDAERERKLFVTEENLDEMQREAVIYLTRLLSGSVPHDVAMEGRRQLRISDEWESISDELVRIQKMMRKLSSEGVDLDQAPREEILMIHKCCRSYMDLLIEAFRKENHEIAPDAKVRFNEISELIKSARTAHVDRMTEAPMRSWEGTIFPDILNAYRTIKEHTQNIADSTAATP